jgi:CBS domain-containing protein
LNIHSGGILTTGTISTSKTVGDIELKEAIQVGPGTYVLEASKEMAVHNSDCVLVVDSAGGGMTPAIMSRPSIVGIMTVKDVVNKVVAQGRDPAKTKVSEVMASPVNMTDSAATLYAVASLMNQNDFRQMPVVDNYTIRGIVSSRMINMAIINGIIEDIKLMVSIFR